MRFHQCLVLAKKFFTPARTGTVAHTQAASEAQEAFEKVEGKEEEGAKNSGHVRPNGVGSGSVTSLESGLRKLVSKFLSLTVRCNIV